MMGHRTKQFKLFAPTSLDALVPSDNFYRRLEEKLDLSFVRGLVRDCYDELGRPSIDRVVFFKLQLIAFFERIMELCLKAGLVEGDELCFDAILVEANASMDSLRPRLSQAAAREHVQKIFAENAPATEAVEPASPDHADDTHGSEGDAGDGTASASAGSVFRRLPETYRHARRTA